MTDTRLRPILLLAAAMLLFIPMVGARDIVTSHEGRIRAEQARQMTEVGWPWEGGRVSVPVVGLKEYDGMKRLAPLPGEGRMDVNPWLVPVLSGEVRLQKPPLPYWCSAVLFKLFKFGEGYARLPAAALGAVGVLLVFDLGRLLLGRVGGWCAAMVWISSYFIFDEYRKSMADPYLAFFSLLCVWAWVKGSRQRLTNDDVGRTPVGSLGYVFLFYVSLALGALAEAPVNFLHVGTALASYHLCYRRRPPGRWWQHLAGVSVFLALALPWPLYIMAHVKHALELWRYESIGEFSDNTEKAHGVFFYVPSVFQVIVPWTPIWLTGVVRIVVLLVRRRDRRPLFPILWFLLTLVVFSASNVKKNAYLLPVLPAMVLTTALGMRAVIAASRRRRVRGPAGTLIGAHVAIGAAAGLVLPYLIGRAAGPAPAGALARVGLGCISLAAAFLLGAWPFIALKRGGGRQWAATQAAVYAVGIGVLFNFALAPFNNDRSAKHAARAAAAMLHKPDVTLLVPALPEEASVYLPLGLQFDPDKPRVLVIVDDRGSQASKSREWFQARVSSGRIVDIRRVPAHKGNERFKLFELTVDKKWFAATG